MEPPPLYEWRVFLPVINLADLNILKKKVFNDLFDLQLQFTSEQGLQDKLYTQSEAMAITSLGNLQPPLVDDYERREDTYVVGKPYFGLKARAGKKAEIKIRTNLTTNGLEVWVRHKLGKSSLQIYTDEVVQLLKKYNVYEDGDEEFIRNPRILKVEKKRRVEQKFEDSKFIKKEICLISLKDHLFEKKTRQWVSVAVESMFRSDELLHVLTTVFPTENVLWRYIESWHNLLKVEKMDVVLASRHMPIYAGYPSLLCLAGTRNVGDRNFDQVEPLYHLCENLIKLIRSKSRSFQTPLLSSGDKCSEKEENSAMLIDDNKDDDDDDDDDGEFCPPPPPPVSLEELAAEKNVEDNILHKKTIYAGIDTKKHEKSEYINRRLARTEPPYIEDVFTKYSAIPDILSLAVGASGWTPPRDAMEKLKPELYSIPPQLEIHHYGSNMGLKGLRDAIEQKMEDSGVDMSSMEVMITCGGNQAFFNVALSLIDEGDRALIIAPYYCSHVSAVQLAGAAVDICPFDPTTLLVSFAEMRTFFDGTSPPKVVVLTSPNNPSGVIYPDDAIAKIVAFCKGVNAWLIVDEAYQDIVFEGYTVSPPCGKRFQYERIVHVSTFSKAFGMMGWRVGYAVYPSSLSGSMKKVNDTLPTHTAIISQKLALFSMQTSELLENEKGVNYVEIQLQKLVPVRDKLWGVVKQFGTVKTFGAYYFLVPIPKRPDLTEELAVHILATQYKVLVMPGAPFGAPGYIRISYGDITSTSDKVNNAIDRIHSGLSYLRDTIKISSGEQNLAELLNTIIS